jgi:hypothetical protein
MAWRQQEVVLKVSAWRCTSIPRQAKNWLRSRLPAFGTMQADYAGLYIGPADPLGHICQVIGLM